METDDQEKRSQPTKQAPDNGPGHQRSDALGNPPLDHAGTEGNPPAASTADLATTSTASAAATATAESGTSTSTGTSTAEKRDLTPEETKEHREVVAKLYTEAATGFDKTVLAIAGGALTLSATFAKSVFPHPESAWALVAAWVSLVAVLLVLVASMLTGQEANREEYEGTNPGKRQRWGWDWWTKWLNIAAAFLLAVGLGALCLFAGMNIS